MTAATQARALHAVALAGACGLVFAAYANHFTNGFHFDDHHVIVDNLYIRSLHDPGRFFVDPHTFSTRPENASYRPLLTLSYALDYARAGTLDPRPFRRTQFGLLLLLFALIVPLYRRICESVEPGPAARWLALWGATLFAVHVANTETLNYLSSRSNLVATLAIVASMLAYVAWPRRRGTLLYLVPVLIGGLAKPLTPMFAPLVVAWRLLFEERVTPADLGRPEGRRRALSALAAALPALAAGVAVFAFTQRMNAATLRMSDLDWWSYARTEPYVWLHYVRLFVLPTGLTADTDWAAVRSAGDPRLWIGLAFAVTLGAALVVLASRRALAPAAFGLAWFGIALVPESSVVPLSEVANEHRVFFPYVGLTLAAVWLAYAAGRLLARRLARARRALATVAIAAAIALVVAHAAGTHARNRVWRDELSLWEDVVQKSPQNARGLMNYGVALMGRGQLRQALAAFERARAIAPDYEVLEVNLALAKSALGAPGVEDHFRRALELVPGYARGRYFYAGWLVEQGRGAEAVAELEAALGASAGDLEVLGLLARLLDARGDDERKAAIVRQTLAIAPDDPLARSYAAGPGPVTAPADTPAAYAAVARSRARAGDWLGAALAERRAVELAPEAAPAWNDLGWARLKLGFTDEALACFERALALDPALSKAKANARAARASIR